MNQYVRIYPNYSYEFIFISGKWKKKRYHFLVNPGKQIILDIQQQKTSTAVVNPESLTHIISVGNSTENSKHILRRTIELAELLNKPVITSPAVTEYLRGQGLSITQIRTIESDNTGIDELQIKLIYFNEKDFMPEQEHVIHKQESLKSKIIDKPIGTLTKAISIPFKPLAATLNPLTKPLDPAKKVLAKYQNPFKKSHKHIETIVRDHPMIAALFFNKTSFIFPLDSNGADYLAKVIESLQVDWVILPDAKVQSTNEFQTNGGKVLLIDKDYQSDPLFIPRNSNPSIDHDTLLIPFHVWLDLDEYNR